MYHTLRALSLIYVQYISLKFPLITHTVSSFRLINREQVFPGAALTWENYRSCHRFTCAKEGERYQLTVGS